MLRNTVNHATSAWGTVFATQQGHGTIESSQSKNYEEIGKIPKSYEHLLHKSRAFAKKVTSIC